MDNADLINQLVDDIFDGNNTSAKQSFEDILSQKVSSALDQRKIDLAQTMFNSEEE